MGDSPLTLSVQTKVVEEIKYGLIIYTNIFNLIYIIHKEEKYECLDAYLYYMVMHARMCH